MSQRATDRTALVVAEVPMYALLAKQFRSEGANL